MRFLEIRFWSNKEKDSCLFTVIFSVMISTPQILGVIFWNDFASTVYATICVGLLL